MNRTQLLYSILIIVVLAVVTYAYSNNRRQGPLQQTSTSGTKSNVSINVLRCKPDNKLLYRPDGSLSIEVQGWRGINCVLKVYDEIEGGVSAYTCRIPILLIRFPIYSAYRFDDSMFCTSRGTYNIFFDLPPADF
jgi:hypothetical protein